MQELNILLLQFFQAFTVFAKPNVIIYLADDIGYGDFKSYGHPTQPWGPLDDLARSGMQMMQFYADSLCTPSRSQLLTGRLPVRTGLIGDTSKGKEDNRILQMEGSGGLPRDEITIAELLRDAGYATGMLGKWHLGINKEKSDDGYHLPFHHGFDWLGEYFPFGVTSACDENKINQPKPNPAGCFIYKGNATVPHEQPVRMSTIAKRMAASAKEFITTNKNRNFFLYFPAPHCHTSIFAGPEFWGKTSRGYYGDCVAELSWVMGEMVQHLRDEGLDRNTLIIFFSDNGAQRQDCLGGGNNGLLRAGKQSSFEGGHRVPAVFYWPWKIPAGISSSLTYSVDIFPTLAKLAEVPLPPGVQYDGTDISDILFNPPETYKQPNSTYWDRPIWYYCNDVLMAVRRGPYKLFYLMWKWEQKMDSDKCTEYDGYSNPTVKFSYEEHYMSYCTAKDKMTQHNPPLIFNVEADPSEMYPLNPKFHGSLIKETARIVAAHKATIRKVTAQNDIFLPDPNVLIPCCLPDVKNISQCYCNYP